MKTKTVENKYLILELLEEEDYTEEEWEENVCRYVQRDFVESESLVKNKIMIEWLPGTRFFRVPASIFFLDEALRDEEDDGHWQCDRCDEVQSPEDEKC